MRKSMRTILCAGVAAAFGASAAGVALHAEDDDAENAKIAQEALDKAVAKGKELFHGNTLGKKTCAACHENPDKPNLALSTRNLDYPRYSNKAKQVVSLGQKINEMIPKAGGTKTLDLSGPDVVALEAYVMSLKKK